MLTANTAAVVSGGAEFEYTEEGNITQVEPSFGQAGTVVTIYGTNLLGGGSSADVVTVADVPLSSVSSANESVVVGRLGSSPATSGPLEIVSDTGAIVGGSVLFTYLSETAVTLVSPSEGQYGVYVNIYGSGMLAGGTSVDEVLLGGVPASILNSADTLVRVRAGASLDLGVGDVIVISDTGATSFLANAWTYDVPSNITAVCV